MLFVLFILKQWLIVFIMFWCYLIPAFIYLKLIIEPAQLKKQLLEQQLLNDIELSISEEYFSCEEYEGSLSMSYDIPYDKQEMY